MDDPLRVVLVSPRNPLNIGAVARAMSNFGVRQLSLVNPYDAAFREAKSAVKSHYILNEAQVFSSLPEAIGDCQLVVGTTAADRRDLRIPLYRIEAGASIIKSHAKPVALLFGSEKFGLSNDDLSFCHWVMRIPTRAEHGSMNLGQAAAICLYELHRNEDAGTFRYPAPEQADEADYHRFTQALIEVLKVSGYTEERTSESSEMKTRQLVRRLALHSADSKTWMGIMRQILWKLHGGSERPDGILNRDDQGPDYI